MSINKKTEINCFDILLSNLAAFEVYFSKRNLNLIEHFNNISILKSINHIISPKLIIKNNMIVNIIEGSLKWFIDLYNIQTPSSFFLRCLSLAYFSKELMSSPLSRYIIKRVAPTYHPRNISP